MESTKIIPAGYSQGADVIDTAAAVAQREKTPPPSKMLHPSFTSDTPAASADNSPTQR